VGNVQDVARPRSQASALPLPTCCVPSGLTIMVVAANPEDERDFEVEGGGSRPGQLLVVAPRS
jgi:hypothetical protein